MLTLFLMGQKGYDVLGHIIEHEKAHLLDAVVSEPDLNVKKDYYNEISERCQQHQIAIFDKSHRPNSSYSLAISWRRIISDSSSKVIVIHDSLLPKYRGFAPVVNALINGEKEIGATAILATEKYDCGEIILQKKIQITYPKKIQTAIDELSELYKDISLQLIQKLEDTGELSSTPQDANQASYSLWRNEDDYLINWNLDAETIERHVNATGSPYLGASTYVSNEKCRVLEVEQYPDVTIENRNAGKVIFVENGYPVVVCEKGLLKIIEMTNELGESMLPLKSFRTHFSNRSLDGV